MGVCGKNPQVATLQDLLVYKLRELSQLMNKAKESGFKDEKIDVFIAEALFVTLTNVNFDPDSIVKYLRESEELQGQVEKQLKIETAFQPVERFNGGLNCSGQKSWNKR